MAENIDGFQRAMQARRSRVLRSRDEAFAIAGNAYRMLSVADRQKVRVWLEKLREMLGPDISLGPVAVQLGVEISCHLGAHGFDVATVPPRVLLDAIDTWDRDDLYLPDDGLDD